MPVKSMTTSLQCCINYILCWSRDEWSLRMLCLVHQSLASTALSYLVLCDLYLSMVVTISTHLSTGRAILRMCTSFHHRSFAVTGPCLWNSFLATLWQMIFIFGQEITAHCDFWFFLLILFYFCICNWTTHTSCLARPSSSKHLGIYNGTVQLYVRFTYEDCWLD